jgi:cobalamin biosynthesis Mg chelatase CobN
MLRARYERVAKSVWTGQAEKQGRSERSPMSFALLAVVSVVATVALVLLLYTVPIC